MPLQTETVVLAEECERLRDEMDDLAEKQARMDLQGDRAAQLMQRGNQLDRYITVLEKLQAGDIETMVAFEEVTLAGLSPGDINRVEDVCEKYQSVRERDAWVALGSRDAPYVKHDPDAVEDVAYHNTIRHLVDNCPLPYLRWAEERISDLSHLGTDEGNGYLQLVQDKRATKTSETDG